MPFRVLDFFTSFSRPKKSLKIVQFLESLYVFSTSLVEEWTIKDSYIHLCSHFHLTNDAVKHDHCVCVCGVYCC